MEALPIEVWNEILKGTTFPAKTLTKISYVSKYFNLIVEKTRQYRQKASELVAPSWLHDLRKNVQFRAYFGIIWLLDEEYTRDRYYRDCRNYKAFGEEKNDFGIDESKFLCVGGILPRFPLDELILKFWIHVTNPTELHLSLSYGFYDGYSVLFIPMGTEFKSIADVLLKYSIPLRSNPNILALDVAMTDEMTHKRLNTVPMRLYPDEHPNIMKLFLGFYSPRDFANISSRAIDHCTYKHPLVSYLSDSFLSMNPLVVKKRTLFSHSILTYYHIKEFSFIGENGVQTFGTFLEVNYPHGYKTPNHDRICQAFETPNLPEDLPADVVAALLQHSLIVLASNCFEQAEQFEVMGFYYAAAVLDPTKRRLALERLADEIGPNVEVLFIVAKLLQMFKHCKECPKRFSDRQITDDAKFKEWILEQIRHPSNDNNQSDIPICIDKPFPANQNYDERSLLTNQIKTQI